jgi:gliding motility-associated-like protein
MLKRLNYILLMTLFLAIQVVAQAQSVIDKVCKDAVRTYRVDGEPGLTYIWILKDHLGNSVSIPSGAPFTDTDTSGNLIEGSEITIAWSFTADTYSLSVEKQSSFSCSTDELGTIEVVPKPFVNAGLDQTVCGGTVINLSDAKASDITTSGLEWTTAGDGTFDNPNAVNPSYTPGPGDLLAGKVVLKISAKSMGDSDGCIQEDEVELTIVPQSKLVITNPAEVCESTPVDLTAASITIGSTIPPTANRTYWKDSGATIPLSNPNFVITSGTYYIKLDVNGKCPDVQPVIVKVKTQPNLVIHDPLPVCEPSTVDISTAFVTDPGVLITYWNDGAATSPLSNFNAINVSGNYFVKATDSYGCFNIQPVKVEISKQIVPQFNFLTEFCLSFIAPALPTTSINGIKGTWIPSAISTSSLGKTLYNFSPDAGQCALTYSIEINITNEIIPVFASMGPFCQSTVAPTLPTKSSNGVSGTWSPAAISTATIGSTGYVFTPDSWQCSNPVTIPIAINAPITPTFASIGSVCQNSTTNPLPTKSIEGISGTWSPAFSSAAIGAKAYTFTPNIGECANQTTLSITTVPEVIPTFAPIGPLCKNSTPPSLPLTSANGISGTWSPATISTSSIGITNYLFTSVSGGACSNPYNMPIEVVGFNLAYTQVDLGYSTLPIGSIDLTVSGGSGNYSYLWNNGATTQDISGLAAGDYTVTVTDLVTLCSEKQTISITKLINDLVLVTNFTPPLCPGSNDATATVTPSGGKVPYKYLWNTGQTDSIAKSLIAGVYSVTVTDANGLTRGTIITIPETAIKYVIASVKSSDPACFGENGKIELTFGSGGIVPNDYYTILYDGGQFNSVEISGNRATIIAPNGNYNNIRVEIRGCITNSVGPVNIAPAPPALTLPTIATVQPDCDILTGTIEVITPAPMVGITYTVKSTNPLFVPVTNATGVFPGLSVGVYNLTYTDIKGCTSAPIIATINAHPVTPAIPIAIPVLAECEKKPIQTLNANKGIGPPVAGTSILWYDTPIGGNVVSPIWNKPGSVTLYAEATNGECVSVSRTPVTLTIIPTPAAPISKGNLSACESLPLVTLDANDAIDATGKKIVWYDKLVSGNVVTSPTLNALGTVTYYAEDVNGVCASSPRTAVSLTIFSLPSKPTAVVSVVPRCIDTSGVIEVKTPIGSNFVYNIDNGPYQSSVTFNNQSPGSHSMRVKNILTNCESDTTIRTVPDIPPVPKIINLIVENCICYGDSGKLNFEFGNITDGTYVIIYLGGQFENVKVKGNKATVLAKAGTYNVLAIEANGCTSHENWNVEIKQPDQISVSAKITEIDLKSKQKGEIDLTIAGGTGTYQTIWKPNPINGFVGATTEDIKNLDAGIYVVTVTDASGCYRTYIDTIPKANMPPIATDDVFIANCNLVTGDLLYTDNGNGMDSDPDGDPIAIDITPVKTPSHGTLVINPDGTFEYTALLGYTGDDSFRYVIYDIKKNSSNPATVTIHIVSDTDRDGIADDLDPDADGDGILNVDEVISGQNWKTTDSDGDGRPNYLDIDSDNDGIVDNIEAQSTSGYIKPSGIDKDHNGIDDAYDPAQGGVSIAPVDTDGDGIPDFLDVDSDGDGVPDYIEGHDLNADGKPDFVSVGKDSDGDGLDDGFDTVVNVCSPSENVTGSNAAMQDFDGDGLKDWRDENDDDDQYLTRFEDLNMDGDFSNDDTDRDGHPEYLDYGRDCDLFIPNAFSPNNDNIHDYFQIYCIDHFPNARLYIFDQLGNKLYEQKNYGNLEVWGTPERAWWDGRTTNRAATTTNGGLVSPGTYYYVLQLGNGEVKKSFVFVSY